MDTVCKAIAHVLVGAGEPVENLADGSVRAVVNGDMKNCVKFINWCREGSAYSWVEGVDIREMEAENLDRFEIIY